MSAAARNAARRKTGRRSRFPRLLARFNYREPRQHTRRKEVR